MVITAEQRNKANRKKRLSDALLVNNILDEKVDRHHINNTYCVYLPRDLHQLYHFGRGDRIKHRFMANQLVRQLYPHIKVVM